MISRSLLLVLLVLVCLQSFTTAQNAYKPKECCFSYQTQPISVKHMTGYEEAGRECTKPGVIFTLKDGRHVCGNPGVDWVKNCMEKIDQRLFEQA